MDPCANLGCVLKVNVNARSVTCRRRVLEVLHSICDTYNVRIDWETGLTHITAPVYINSVLHALARSGYRAEVVHITRVQPLPPALRPTPVFGRHHIPRHVAFANPLHLRNELDHCHHDSRIRCGRHHHRHGRNGCAPHHEHGVSKCIHHDHHHYGRY